MILKTLIFLSFPLLAVGQQTINGSITHDGLKRDYILYVPESYSPGTPAPLILNFHGYTSNAFEQMNYGDFRPIADTAGFLVVHPLGTVDLLGNNHWNVGWGSSTVDDLGFTAALIDSLSATYEIDQDRIYSTGMSNGGFMSYKLACELSDRIAAIASVTGSMNLNQPASCNPSHPMPVMEIHGTADATVAYNGGFWIESIPAVLNYWATFNSCDTPPVINNIEDTDLSDGSTVEHQLFPNGNNGVEVEHYKIISGGHTWPGTFFSGPGTNQDIDASKEIWRFFSKYDIRGLINTTATSDLRNRVSLSVYPNPAASQISIEYTSAGNVEYRISTLIGVPVQKGIMHAAPQQIDISALPPGMYVLNIGSDVVKFVKTAME
jgi:polyhydroxybutyrate depolymerase